MTLRPSFPPKQTAPVPFSITNANKLMVAKVRPTLPQLINLSMIVEVIRKHFDVQLKPIGRPFYRKLYTNR